MYLKTSSLTLKGISLELQVTRELAFHSGFSKKEK